MASNQEEELEGIHFINSAQPADLQSKSRTDSEFERFSKYFDAVGAPETREDETVEGKLELWSSAPKIIKESSALVTNTVPILEKHGLGSRRLLILWLGVIGALTFILVFSRVDINFVITHWLKNQKPVEECRVTGEGKLECVN